MSHDHALSHGRPRRYRPSEKRLASAQERRARLKASAWVAFADKGLEGSSVLDIVAGSGISTGTFYLLRC